MVSQGTAVAQVDHIGEPDGSGRRPGGERPPDRGSVGARRLEQAIVRVDPKSVLRLSVKFLARLLLVGLGLGVLFWLGALVTGTAGNIDSFLEQLTGFPSLTVLGFQGLLVALVLGLTFVVGGALTAVLVAVVFNLASDLGGGIKMTVMETDLDEDLLGSDGPRIFDETRHSAPPPLRRRRPLLGADVTRLGDKAEEALRGALVVGIEPNSPAHSAGLVAGDIIVSLGGTMVDSPASLSSAINSVDARRAIDLSWVDRRGRYCSATVDLDERAS